MGGSANVFEWIFPPLAIAHETIAAVSKGLGGPSLAAPGSRLSKGTQGDPFLTFLASPNQLNKMKPSSPAAVAKKPGMSQEEIDRLARVELQKRRRDFKDTGRSGTILTGASGLSGSGPGTQKTLLGY